MALLEDAERQVERHAEGVEHRQERVHDLLAVLRLDHPRCALEGVRVQVAVRQHRALGIAGRPGRVLDDGEIVDSRLRVLGVDPW